jgi:signal transduction histidine kinase
MRTSQALDSRRVCTPGVRVRLALWWFMVAASVIVLSNAAVVVAAWQPTIAVVVSLMAAVVDMALFQLGLVRFKVFGRPLDLLIGIAFGTCALMNLASTALEPGIGIGVSRLGPAILLALVTHGFTYLLVAVAVCHTDRLIAVPHPRWTAAFVTSAAILFAVSLFVVWVGPDMPAPVETEVVRSVRAGAPVSSLLDAQAGWLLIGNAALTMLVVIATSRLGMLASHQPDPGLASLGRGLCLLGLSQALTLLFPSGVPGYVSVADAFELLAHLALLFGLVIPLTEDVAHRASANERMRLSRELHDGLVQELSVLNLRLAEAPLGLLDSTNDQPTRNLDACRRLARTALMEARQAITSLRSGSIAWEDFIEALEAFCDETSQNHEVDIELHLKGALPSVEAALQVDVMRMLTEIISNAVCHGGARRIGVDVEVRPHPVKLVMSVRDDGHGFTPVELPIGGGVGLRSLTERVEGRAGKLALESCSAGTIVRLELPLKRGSIAG